MRLIVAGGGTGGHLFPGIAVAEEFLARDPGNEVLFVGTRRGIEARVLPKLGYRLELIATSGMRGKSPAEKIKGLWLLCRGYLQSRKIVREFRPDLVLGVGGYSSGPLVLAARRSGRCYIHEQNAIPGMTNRLLARIVRKVFLSLEESARYLPEKKSIMTGNPLRREIARQGGGEFSPRDRSADFHLLVFGGSAGAHRINMAMIEALTHLDRQRERLVVTHQTGGDDLDAVSAAYRERGFRADVRSFIDDMADAYRRADLIVCRAGATTIAEVTACAKACVFVPYPFAADDHQRKNAEALVRKDAGFMIPDGELDGERVAEVIISLMGDPAQLARTEANAGKMAKPEAARIIVDIMLADNRNSGKL